jgi:23S rRNA-/tRNA-specific pseudouridylate synthase
LDNDTAGFLYFARTQETYDKYKTLQREWKIQKFYLAQIYGKLKIENWPVLEGGKLEIKLPIKHRTSEKMIAIQNPRDALKGRWKEHQAITTAELVHYDSQRDISTLLVSITKGIRHQIRVHLASACYPIIWDCLYGMSGNEEYLHLRSIGFQIP